MIRSVIAIAAIALPPQMAVPEDKSRVILESTFSNLPNKSPQIITKETVKAVSIKPLFEALITWVKFMPKPRSTIDAFKRNEVYLARSILNPSNDRTRPNAKAIAGETKGIKQINMAKPYIKRVDLGSTVIRC